ncbi:hypothetical protein H6F93_29955 [Leptolyngbya sp. FACHB-671]|uniref:hypothetical protein n=1 Tax=Leptolyngbya sp. FACHB-671 TaxID=2692812 RepID=UPI0016892CE7|nr:hypothetical protein [Leptolyngbya sp. FACHB-671]MBD2071695.1 hypothetical protein [Leptolyngbya sp. FACHB-671]
MNTGSTLPIAVTTAPDSLSSGLRASSQAVSRLGYRKKPSSGMVPAAFCGLNQPDIAAFAR